MVELERLQPAGSWPPSHDCPRSRLVVRPWSHVAKERGLISSHMRPFRRAVILAACLALGRHRSARAQQDIGHKLLGGVGIDAGVQADSGLYIAIRVARYGATQLRDRSGGVVPLAGFDLDAWAGAIGAAYVTKPLGKHATYLSFGASLPVAKISLSVDDPRVDIDRSGFGDAYIQPLAAGWRLAGFDVLTSYSLYLPTGRFEPQGGSGVGRGFTTQELSLGGAAFLNGDRRRRVSALVSYDVNSRKHGIDITRGNTIQVQGGVGAPVARGVTLGLAGYALWQVSADRGTALPGILRGQHDRVFGLGPEIQFAVPALALRAEARVEFDLGARSRPSGVIGVGGLTYRRG